MGFFFVKAPYDFINLFSDSGSVGDAAPGCVNTFKNGSRCAVTFLVLEKFKLTPTCTATAKPLALVLTATHGGNFRIRTPQQWTKSTHINRYNTGSIFRD